MLTLCFSPWEAISPFYSTYVSKFDTDVLARYASMISNMDENIGRLIRHVDDLGIGSDTLIVFTSDNGPENEAGSPGPFKGRKRTLMEGGIRVPCIVRWKDHINPGLTKSHFAINTDLFPTFVQVARGSMPWHAMVDGISILPMITGKL